MTFISEKIIDQVSERLEQTEGSYENLVEEMNEAQPALVAYLFSEAFSLLTEEEQNYMLYLAIIIWQSVQDVHPTIKEIDEETIVEKDEANWETMNQSNAKKFRDRLNAFFEKTPQEDLLAFAEDSLANTEDEDEFLTEPGREMIFVGLKTVVDVLTEQ